MTKNEIYIGDTHSLRAVREIIYDKKDCIFYHVGDVGVGFDYIYDSYWLQQINVELTANNSFLYLNSGNHDCPAYWKYQLYTTNHLKFVQTGDVINNHLFIGGSISIDRKVRTQNVDWWEDEIIQFPIIPKSNDFSIVVSHNAPTKVFPYYYNTLVKNYMKYDSRLDEDLTKERNGLLAFFEQYEEQITHWIYGHFHQSNRDQFKDTEFVCLSINELYEEYR